MDLSLITHSLPFQGTEKWQIITGDCLNIIPRLPVGIFDLIITSPPYNLGITTGGGFPVKKTNKQGKWSGGSLAKGYGGFNDAMSKKEYREWQKKCLLVMWNLLSDAGAIFYNHKPRIQNGLLEHPTEWNPGLPLRQIIIWKRSGGINFSPSFYLPTHEYILVFAKKDFRLKNKGASGVTDVWEMTQEKNNKHPAPFPLSLPLQILDTVKCEKKLVLDPFSGSGTTGVACLMRGFQYVGIELNEEYVQTSVDRLKITEKRLKEDLFGN